MELLYQTLFVNIPLTVKSCTLTSVCVCVCVQAINCICIGNVVKNQMSLKNIKCTWKPYEVLLLSQYACSLTYNIYRSCLL